MCAVRRFADRRVYDTTTKTGASNVAYELADDPGFDSVASVIDETTYSAFAATHKDAKARAQARAQAHVAHDGGGGRGHPGRGRGRGRDDGGRGGPRGPPRQQMTPKEAAAAGLQKYREKAKYDADTQAELKKLIAEQAASDGGSAGQSLGPIDPRNVWESMQGDGSGK